MVNFVSLQCYILLDILQYTPFHFQGATAGKRTLKAGVVPSLNLPRAVQITDSQQRRRQRADRRNAVQDQQMAEGLDAYSVLGAEEEGKSHFTFVVNCYTIQLGCYNTILYK